MKSDYRGAVWYLVTLTLATFTLTVLFTIQGSPTWAWIFTVIASVLQLFGLVYYLHRTHGKKEPAFVKFILVMLRLSSFAVAALFVASLYYLASQYHNPVMPTEGDSITIVQTDNLNIMYPGYDTVEFVCGKRPSRGDKGITYCSAAAFQQKYSLSFTHDEIASTHVQNGELYQGYYLKGLGAFTFYNGVFHFTDNDGAAAEMERAAKSGGNGFRQYSIIENGEIMLDPIKDYRCYRVLAELDGKLCVIDSRKQVYFADFARDLQKAGVTNALYLDMGCGWNYSWYRDNTGQANTLIGLIWPFSHNWIVFRTTD